MVVTTPPHERNAPIGPWRLVPIKDWSRPVETVDEYGHGWSTYPYVLWQWQREMACPLVCCAPDGARYTTYGPTVDRHEP